MERNHTENISDRKHSVGNVAEADQRLVREYRKHVLTTKERVRHLLKRYVGARNSDRVLAIHYLKTYQHMQLSPEMEEALLQTPTTTIIKSRQFVTKENPELEATDPKVRKARHLRDRAMKELSKEKTQSA